MPSKNIIKKTTLSPTSLIVGGAGFIGSHLAEALLQKNSRVVVLDNFSTGKDVYVHSLLDNPKFALFNVDINQGIPAEIESVDYVFQLAGLETYLFDKSDLSLDSLLTNALGTKNILDFVKRSNAKFLLGSTIDVYKGLISPISLDQYFGLTLEEEKKYSLTEAKRYAEALVWEYYKKHDINARVARLPEVYGPRMNPGSCGSLGLLIKNLVDHKDLVVYGEGVSKEYYLYISDAISGLMKAIFSDSTEGQIYTFANKDPRTVLETTYLVKGLASTEARVVFRPKAEAIETQTPIIPDRSSLQGLNWEEKVPFRDGVVKTLKWFGYEPNENSFKPAKYLEDSSESTSVSSIIDNPENIATPQQKAKKHKQVNLLKKERSPIFGFLNKKKASEFTKKITQKFSLPLTTFKEHFSKSFYSNGTFIYYAISTCLILFGMLAIFIGVPFLQTYLHAKKGVGNIKKVESAAYTFDSTTAQAYADNAYSEFIKAQGSLNRVSWVFSLVGKTKKYNDIQNLLKAAEHSSKATYFLSKGVTPFAQLWTALNGDGTAPVDKSAFDKAYGYLLTAQNNLGLAEAEVQQVSLESTPSDVGAYINLLHDFSRKSEILVAMAADFPELAGMMEQKNYLVLFQNTNEVRPTGGFIGSYATISIKDGQLQDIIIDDVYNPDGQLDLRDVLSIPPEPIKEYLGEERLHIRNANWDPDFTVSSEVIKDLFFRVDGRTYDGVISVDLHFVQELLDLIGPIFLAAYNEEINADNLYERTQFHSEFNYETGSDQKKILFDGFG